jgi:hypothetical protein
MDRSMGKSPLIVGDANNSWRAGASLKRLQGTGKFREMGYSKLLLDVL